MTLNQSRLDERVEAFTTAGTLSERTDAFVALVRWARYGADDEPRSPAVFVPPRASDAREPATVTQLE